MLFRFFSKLRIKKPRDTRIILARITKKEQIEHERLALLAQVFGTYNHMELPETNDICRDICKHKEKDLKEYGLKLINQYGFDTEQYCLWSDGVITAKPKNYDELKKESEIQKKQNQQHMEDIQLNAMAKYGFTTSKNEVEKKN